MRTQTPVNVNNSGWTDIITVGPCREVQVQETGAATGADYLVAAPTITDGPKTVQGGREYSFVPADSRARFAPGTKVGSLKLLNAGSVNFDPVEL
jgi:hypothetical protein